MADDEFVVNFVDVATGFEPVPMGMYHVKISGHEGRTTKAESEKYPNTPMINWEFTIMEGKYRGRKLWTNHIIHPNTLSNLKGMLKATGEFSDEDLNSSEFRIVPRDYYDLELAAKVTLREYPKGSDEWTNNIQRFKNLADTTPEDFEESDESGSSLLP